MLLEDIRPEENSHQILHLISLKNGETAKIGRGQDSGIRLSDISVSRIHSKIKFLKGKFFIHDAKSKFGTLLQIKKELNVRPGQSVVIQVNRTIVKIAAKVP